MSTEETGYPSGTDQTVSTPEVGSEALSPGSQWRGDQLWSADGSRLYGHVAPLPLTIGSHPFAWAAWHRTADHDEIRISDESLLGAEFDRFENREAAMQAVERFYGGMPQLGSPEMASAARAADIPLPQMDDGPDYDKVGFEVGFAELIATIRADLETGFIRLGPADDPEDSIGLTVDQVRELVSRLQIAETQLILPAMGFAWRSLAAVRSEAGEQYLAAQFSAALSGSIWLLFPPDSSAEFAASVLRFSDTDYRAFVMVNGQAQEVAETHSLGDAQVNVAGFLRAQLKG